ARRHLRNRVRRLLAADGATRLHGRQSGCARDAPRAHAAVGTIHSYRVPDSFRARRPGAVVPGQGSGGPTADGKGALAPPCVDRAGERVVGRKGPGMVDAAPAASPGRRLVNRSIRQSFLSTTMGSTVLARRAGTTAATAATASMIRPATP